MRRRLRHPSVAVVAFHRIRRERSDRLHLRHSMKLAHVECDGPNRRRPDRSVGYRARSARRVALGSSGDAGSCSCIYIRHDATTPR